MPKSVTDLAAWYRQLADKADEPRIWHSRMRTAERLEAEVRHNFKEQQIRERAYALWEREGRPEGRADDHWRRAEAELAKRESLGVTDDGKLLGTSPEEPAIPLPRRR